MDRVRISRVMEEYRSLDLCGEIRRKWVREREKWGVGWGFKSLDTEVVKMLCTCERRDLAFGE